MAVKPEQIVDSLIALVADLIIKLREFGSIEDADEGKDQLAEIVEQYESMKQ